MSRAASAEAWPGTAARARVAQAPGHDVEGGRGRIVVLAVAADRRAFAAPDLAVDLELDEDVAAHVGGAAGDAEHVPELEVERAMLQAHPSIIGRL
jgi:hypothetical protein